MPACIQFFGRAPTLLRLVYIYRGKARKKTAGCVGTADTSSTEIQLFTHHDIVKHYRKGLTAVVDRCVVYAYSSIGTTVCSETFCSLLLFWSRLVHADLAMHATLAALGTLPCSMSL